MVPRKPFAVTRTATRRAGSRRRECVGLLLLALLPGACSEGGSEPVRAPTWRRLRLVDQVPDPSSRGPLLGDEREAGAADPALDLLRDDFDAGRDPGWWWRPKRGAPAADPVRVEGGLLRVPAAPGSLARQVALRSCRDLEISVRVRRPPGDPGLTAAQPCPLQVGELVEMVDEPAQMTARQISGGLAPLADSGAPGGDGFVEYRKRWRLGRRTIGVLLAFAAELEPAGIELDEVSVRELSGPERIARTLEEMRRVATPVGDSQSSGRARIGDSFNELLLAPTPTRLVFDLPATSGAAATLSFGCGVLLDTLGRGDGEPVEFRVAVADAGAEDRAEQTVWQTTRQPSAIPRHRAVSYQRVDLGPLPPEGLRLILETRSPAGSLPALAAFTHPVVEIGSRPPRPSVILISIDTFRADSLAVYGGDPALAPRLNAFAQECSVFATAVAPVSFTLPSHASMFSGQYPSVHGMVVPSRHRDLGATRFIAENAREAGLRTAAFTGGLQLSEFMGIEGGFETYHVTDLLRRGDFEELQEWLDSIGDEPFFLLLHTYAAHTYAPPREDLEAVHPRCESRYRDRKSLLDFPLLLQQGLMDEVDKEHLAGVYRGAAHHADRQVGEALSILRARGLLDRALVLVTSDHGEELFEHGSAGHGFTLYEEQVRVPLLIRTPAAGPRTAIGELVELVDVGPTAAEWLGAVPLPEAQGKSLLPLVNRAVREEAGSAYGEIESHGLSSWRSARLKALRKVNENAAEQLTVFDLSRDPGEQAPLAAEHPDHARALESLRARRSQLAELRARLDRVIGTSVLDPETLRELREAGYTFDEDQDR